MTWNRYCLFTFLYITSHVRYKINIEQSTVKTFNYGLLNSNLTVQLNTLQTAHLTARD